MKTILIPTDGSAAADKALDLALDLAQCKGAKIKLFHVLLRDKEPEELLRLPGVAADEPVLAELQGLLNEPATDWSPQQIMDNPDRPLRPSSDALLTAVGNDILTRANSRAEARGVVVDVLGIADDRTAPAIVKAASDLKADTIVMGMRGLGQIEEVTFGSVSHEVCRLAGCTCITVH